MRKKLDFFNVEIWRKILENVRIIPKNVEPGQSVT